MAGLVVMRVARLPHIARLYRYRGWRPHEGEMTRMVVREVLAMQGVVVMIAIRGLLQPGCHLVIHIFWF